MFFFLVNYLMALGHFGKLNFIASTGTWIVSLLWAPNCLPL